nr:WbqC family protein [Dyadobacter sp. NIV53]
MEKKFLKTVQQSYQKAPYFEKTFSLVEEIVYLNIGTINELAYHALKKVCTYMEIKTEIVSTSAVYKNTDLKGQERILDICKQENASHYINPVGGMELYEKSKFANESIRLNFLKSVATPYSQFKNAFVPWLSIIDILMFNDNENISKLLKEYELI